MGMPTAFTKEADFSGIFTDPLVISQVSQKSLIEIVEEDTNTFDESGKFACDQRNNQIFKAMIIHTHKDFLISIYYKFALS